MKERKNFESQSNRGISYFTTEWYVLTAVFHAIKISPNASILTQIKYVRVNLAHSLTMVNKTQYKRISECAACLLSLAHKVVSPSVSIKRQSVLPLKNKSTFKHMQMQIGGTLQPKFPFSFAYRWNAECTQWLQYIWSYFRLSIWAARTGMQWIRVFFAIESKNQLIWNILKFI